ncbi:hypothetical protein EI555_016068, partial [Monodon monoceros]
LLWLWDQGEKKCISTEILGFVQDGRKAYTVSAATLFIRGKLKNHVQHIFPEKILATVDDNPYFSWGDDNLGSNFGLVVHFLAVGKTITKVIFIFLESYTMIIVKKQFHKCLMHFKILVYTEYINSQVIKLLSYPNGSSVQLQLTFKFPPAKKNSMRTKIKAILHLMLKDNMASWNAVPTSIKLIGCGGRLTNSITAGNRIVNGENALTGAWPWQASMQWKGQHHCGVSLISSMWLLSAAHCFAKKNNSEDWTINFVTIVNKPYMTQKVQNILFHENYSRAGVHDDIALVQLAEEVSFTKYIHRICFSEAKMKLSENDSVVVTEWGTLYINVILQQAFLKITDNIVCNAPHALSGLATDTMLCAGFIMILVDH